MKYDFTDNYILGKKAVEKDFKSEWNATRYMVKGKMFVMQGGDKEGKPILSFKHDPAYGAMLREKYSDIVPGYYLNKQHWSSLYLEGSVPDDIVKELLDHAYECLLSSLPKKVREEIGI